MASSNEYMNEYMKKRAKKRRQEAIDYLGGACVVCNTKENLEFDHIDPKTKTFTISRGYSFNNEKFWLEVDKCQLLCRDHHILKGIENKEFKGGHNKVTDYGHGTGYMHNNDKCRCTICREWGRQYRKKNVTYAGEPTLLTAN